MSRAYKFHKPDGLYFLTFATVSWVDVFTRRDYKDIVIESLRFCQKEKGLLLFAWVIMSNHVHLIAEAAEGFKLQDIVRDLKKYTSKQIIRAISRPPQGVPPTSAAVSRAFRPPQGVLPKPPQWSPALARLCEAMAGTLRLGAAINRICSRLKKAHA